MGYLIDTIFNQKLSTEEKIERMDFALTFDWKQHPSNNIWDTLKQLGLAPYVKEYSFYEDYSPKDYQAIDVNEYDKKGWLPLSAAIATQNLSIIHWLLERNASINRYNQGEKPPLYMAIQVGSLMIFELLHHHGANLLYGKDCGKSIPLLEFAIKQKQVAIVQYMLSVREMQSIENVAEIGKMLALAKTLRGKSCLQEDKAVFSDIIKVLEKVYNALCVEKDISDGNIHDAATKIQAAFHGKYIQTAYRDYINRPSVDVLLDNNKFEQAKKAINQIKKQKAILGLSRTVHFEV